jgi:hypothetical protein
MDGERTMARDGSQTSGSSLLKWWQITLVAAFLAALYLPTLTTRFDFIDDGNLVYPSESMPLGERLQLVWQKIEANYTDLGPFRPVLWAHWETEAEQFHGDARLWRLARLIWVGFAAASMLWFLRELGIRPFASVLATALAVWNPFRGEVWTSLTLAEGVAMPYAILSLVFAIRASRSSRSWPWDIGSVICVLAALGCKNTFAALIPVQFLLRICAGGLDFRTGLRRHGLRAGLLSLTLLEPVIHYVYFKLNWRPGQYQTDGAGMAQFVRMVRAVAGAESIDFMAAGLLLTVVAMVVQGLRNGRIGDRWDGPWKKYRVACLAGIGLLVLGIGIYLPIGAVSGRYSMPAVWGADICIAALVSCLTDVKAVTWRRTAFAGLCAGLVAVAVANVGKQQKFAARAELLWETLEFVERTAPQNACIAWVEGPELNREEGIHFNWHLHARGRNDLTVRLLDSVGNEIQRNEVAKTAGELELQITGAAIPFLPGHWHMSREFASSYWGNKRGYHCYLWGSTGAGFAKR